MSVESKSSINGSEIKEQIKDQADKAIDWARDSLSQADKEARFFIRERPIVSLLGAVGLGYLVGRFLTRSR